MTKKVIFGALKDVCDNVFPMQVPVLYANHAVGRANVDADSNANIAFYEWFNEACLDKSGFDLAAEGKCFLDKSVITNFTLESVRIVPVTPELTSKSTQS